MKELAKAIALTDAILILVAVGFPKSPRQQTNQKPVAPKVYTVSFANITPLQGLIRFAKENRVPVGIVVGAPAGLCDPARKIDLADAPLESVLNALIPVPEYGWSNEGGVFVVKPRTVPESSSFLLQLRFDRFGTIKTTFQGLGAILAGRIYSALHPGEGFAGDILSSTSAEEVQPMTLENITVEEVANHIVLQAGKGLWILYPAASTREEFGDSQQIYTYGYSDDATTLSNLSCSNPIAYLAPSGHR